MNGHCTVTLVKSTSHWDSHGFYTLSAIWCSLTTNCGDTFQSILFSRQYVIASFLGLPQLQFLITCSMQKQQKNGAGEGLGTRLNTSQWRTRNSTWSLRVDRFRAPVWPFWRVTIEGMHVTSPDRQFPHTSVYAPPFWEAMNWENVCWGLFYELALKYGACI